MSKELKLAWREEIKEMSDEQLIKELFIETGDWKRDCEREMLIRLFKRGVRSL